MFLFRSVLHFSPSLKTRINTYILICKNAYYFILIKYFLLGRNDDTDRMYLAEHGKWL